MKKTLFTLAPAALMLLAVGSAHASSSATLQVSGSVSANSCSLNFERPSINLQNTIPTGFTPNQIRAEGQQTLNLTITDCTSAPGEPERATIQVTGTTLNANTSIFNNDSAPNVGVMVMNGASPIASGEIIEVATGEDIVGATTGLTFGFASTAATADVGLINASIMFNLLIS